MVRAKRWVRRTTSVLIVSTLLGALLATAPAPAGAQLADLVVEGGGWGHGVGMSQYGAQGRALAGHSHVDILSFYYPSAYLTKMASTGIRVAVGPEVSSTSIRVNGGALTFVHEGTGAIAARTGHDGALTLGTWKQFMTLDDEQVIAGEGHTVVAQIPPGATVRVGASGKRYARGAIAVTLAGSGRLRAVVRVPTMREYLYGITEMPYSWHTEALRAQAVAARSYAMNVASRRRAQGAVFDVLDGTGDQVYQGYEAEVRSGAAAWQWAVASTELWVLAYDGWAIQAFYSSSNGGWTERSGYVWAAELPYFQARPDDYDNGGGNPRHRWRAVFGASDFRARVQARTGRDVGEVVRYAVVGQRGTSGRIDKANVLIEGTSGSVTVRGSAFRAMMGINSTLIFDGAGSPFGTIDVVLPSPGQWIRVKGWAIDPNLDGAVQVAVSVNGHRIEPRPAGEPRPDVEAAFPGFGADHGFDQVYELGPGPKHVCMIAHNVGQGVERNLGCQWVELRTGVPFGNFDGLARRDGNDFVAWGWSADPDHGGSVPIHLYVDGVLRGAGRTGEARPDVAAVHPQWGGDRGFRVPVTLPPGRHRVCATGWGDEGVGTSLGCRTVDV